MTAPTRDPLWEGKIAAPLDQDRVDITTWVAHARVLLDMLDPITLSDRDALLRSKLLASVGRIDWTR